MKFSFTLLSIWFIFSIFAELLTCNGLASESVFRMELDFDVRRVLSISDTVFVIENANFAGLSIDSYEITSNNDCFEFVFGSENPISSSGKFELIALFVPDAELELTAEIAINFNNGSSLFIDVLGFGVLPKIEIEPIAFSPTLIDWGMQTQNLTIRNISETSDLFIYKLAIAANNYFRFAEGTETESFYIEKNGGVRNFPIEYFSPYVGEFQTLLLIISDATTGPSVNPRKNDTLSVFAQSFDQAFSDYLVRFPELLTCEYVDTTFYLKNLLENVAIEIQNVKVEPENIEDFSCQIDSYLIQGLDSTRINIVFNPKAIGNRTAELIIETNFREIIIPMSGTGKVAPFIPKIEEIIFGGEYLVPGDTIIVNINAKLPAMKLKQTSNVELNIHWNPKFVFFEEIVEIITNNGNQANLLSYSNEQGRLAIRLSLEVNKQYDFNATVKFSTYLGDSISTNMFLVPEMGEELYCLLPENDWKNLEFNTCFMSGKLIRSTDYDGIIEVFPVPASDNLTINYSLKQENDVTISIYNISGKLQETIINRKQSKGKKEQVIETNKYSSGQYIIELKIGKKRAIKSFIIAK